jgi:hypothetical protein
MSAVYGITAGAANQVARPAKTRTYLAIYNMSTTANVWVAFDAPAVAAPTAGQLTLWNQGTTGQSGVDSFYAFGPGDPQAIPSGAINVIASATAPITIIEG